MEGFTEESRSKLDNIMHVVRDIFTYATDQTTHHIAEYWEDDAILRPSIEGRKHFTGDCEDHAMVCMQRAIAEGFKARLVVCLVETGEGHCICEVVSADEMEALYLDNRPTAAATRQGLIGYTFYSVSPWNPVPGETRPWMLVEQ